uniref:Uncharacterized protein n=1 Tax=Klebsiella pneumoniae TaxID=573 RepID=A0A8B0SZH1_KLEPN|nr:hypothetical protein [Klebsiella pneumoniae]
MWRINETISVSSVDEKVPFVLNADRDIRGVAVSGRARNEQRRPDRYTLTCLLSSPVYQEHCMLMLILPSTNCRFFYLLACITASLRRE